MGQFGISRFIVVCMYLNVVYVYMHTNAYGPTRVKATYNLKRMENVTFIQTQG
jgi:hypothetical protein